MNHKSQKKEKKKFPSWVNGYRYKKQIIKDPYLEIGFKFDSDGKK